MKLPQIARKYNTVITVVVVCVGTVAMCFVAMCVSSLIFWSLPADQEELGPPIEKTIRQIMPGNIEVEYSQSNQSFWTSCEYREGTTTALPEKEAMAYYTRLAQNLKQKNWQVGADSESSEIKQNKIKLDRGPHHKPFEGNISLYEGKITMSLVVNCH